MGRPVKRKPEGDGEKIEAVARRRRVAEEAAGWPYAEFIEGIIAGLEDGHSKTGACKKAGTSIVKFREWYRDYPQFKEVVDIAWEDGAEFYIEAIRAGIVGEHRANPTYAVLGLKLRGMLLDKAPAPVNIEVKILNAGQESIAQGQLSRGVRAKALPERIEKKYDDGYDEERES